MTRLQVRKQAAAIAAAAVLTALVPLVGAGAAGSTGAAGSNWASQQRVTVYKDAVAEITERSARQASKSAALAGPARQTLRVLSHDVNAKIIDIRPRGGDPTPGDMYMAEGRLFNPSHSERIGSQATRCIFGITTFNCERVFSLTGRGKIHLTVTAGREHLKFEPGLAVIGGTGNFVGVGGEATSISRKEVHPNKDLLTVVTLVR